MDQKSSEMLEFPKVRERLAGFCTFSASRELARTLEPHTDSEVISTHLAESAEARRLLATHPGITVGEFADVRQLARLAHAGKVLDARELIDVQRMLSATRVLRASLTKVANDVPNLWKLSSQIADLSVVENETSRCIAPNGDVLDLASTRLGGIRQRLRHVRQDLIGRLQSFMASSRGQKVVQEPIITERDGRFVIPLRVEFRKEVRGIVHDVSNTGQTLFIEPWMTVDLGNELRQLHAEEQQEIEKILAGLSGLVGDREPQVSRNVVMAARLDLAFAKARYADMAKAIEARIDCDGGNEKQGSGERRIKLVNARHPLLMGKVVPLSLEIGGEHRIMVISGPNTGGKTVALKTVGLLSLMTQAGMPVPASEGTCLPIFDNIYADIGDEQSIEHTLSTFSWHIGNVVRIINGSTKKSLVLLDELGTSTDPSEGTALARAVLHHFLDQGTLGIVTTHYTDIKVAAQTAPGLQNASLAFDPETLGPTYHLIIGVPGSSNALAIATRLGLPEKVIAAAKELQSRGSVEAEAVIRDLTLEKQKIFALRSSLEDQEKRIESRRQFLEEEALKLRQREMAEQQEIRLKLAQEASEMKRQIRVAASELKKTVSKKNLERARTVLADYTGRTFHQETVTAGEKELGSHPSMPVGLGERVWLSDVGVWGTVAAFFEEEDQLEVHVGNVRIRLLSSEVKKAGQGEQEGRTYSVKMSERAGRASMELDLRGKRADEIEPVLDAYLNDSFVSRLPEVRIIHGVGTGTVRQIVREVLRSHPLIRSFRPGGRGEGGDGVTMASLSVGE